MVVSRSEDRSAPNCEARCGNDVVHARQDAPANRRNADMRLLPATWIQLVAAPLRNRRSYPSNAPLILCNTRDIARGRLRFADGRFDRSVVTLDRNSRHGGESGGTSEHLATFGAGTIIKCRNATPMPLVPSAPWMSTARLSGACSKPFEASRRRREAGQSSDRGPRTGPGRRGAPSLSTGRSAGPFYFPGVQSLDIGSSANLSFEGLPFIITHPMGSAGRNSYWHLSGSWS